MSQNEIAGRLLQVCERWIYTTCFCFALDLEEQQRSSFHYQYSVFQIEYSRNLLLHSGRQMDEIFQALIDHHKTSARAEYSPSLWALSAGRYSRRMTAESRTLVCMSSSAACGKSA
jgi:hypothetical protein